MWVTVPVWLHSSPFPLMHPENLAATASLSLLSKYLLHHRSVTVFIVPFIKCFFNKLFVLTMFLEMLCVGCIG